MKKKQNDEMHMCSSHKSWQQSTSLKLVFTNIAYHSETFAAIEICVNLQGQRRKKQTFANFNLTVYNKIACKNNSSKVLQVS